MTLKFAYPPVIRNLTSSKNTKNKRSDHENPAGPRLRILSLETFSLETFSET